VTRRQSLATCLCADGRGGVLIDGGYAPSRAHELSSRQFSRLVRAPHVARPGRDNRSKNNPGRRCSVLPAGFSLQIPRSFSATVFDLILELLQAKYDMIIMDTPQTSESAMPQRLLRGRPGAGRCGCCWCDRHHTRVR